MFVKAITATQLLEYLNIRKAKLKTNVAKVS